MQQSVKREIIKQAVNFDKLKWNEKTINMLLAPYILMSIWCIYAFFYSIYKNPASPRIIEVVVYLSVVLPMIWFSIKNYLFSLFVLAVVMLVLPAYNFIEGNGINSLGFLFAAFIISQWFNEPIKIELYRRKHGLSKPKNIKKDIVIGIILALIFPALWLLSALWR